jgi:diphthine synthase
MLYLIGIGLWDARDITLKGLDVVKRCTRVYRESYTSRLSASVSDLEHTYGKKIILADRSLVENGEEILNHAENEDTALLIIGDVFAATTHLDLMLRARERGIEVRTIFNASVLTAVGVTGLELYKFGRVTSIPFLNANVSSPIDVYKSNKKSGLHTLFLFDLDPQKNKYLTIADACTYLLEHKVSAKTQAIGCAGLGSDSPEIRYAQLSTLKSLTFHLLPQCLIIPGTLHFMEEEALKRYKGL